jgi:hypothetical protein
MATSGEKRRPQLGRARWPLTHGWNRGERREVRLYRWAWDQLQTPHDQQFVGLGVSQRHMRLPSLLLPPWIQGATDRGPPLCQQRTWSDSDQQPLGAGPPGRGCAAWGEASRRSQDRSPRA